MVALIDLVVWTPSTANYWINRFTVNARSAKTVQNLEEETRANGIFATATERARAATELKTPLTVL